MGRDTPRIPTGIDYNEFTPEQIQNARLTAARNCQDAEDLYFLLDVLGLLPKEPEPTPQEIAEEKRQRRALLKQQRQSAIEAERRAIIVWLSRNEE
jgi:hypothetical protein